MHVEIGRYCHEKTITITGFTACATPISAEKAANADYGPAPTKGYQEAIKSYFARNLIDPTSPLYEFEKPKQGYFKNSPLFETKESFGWLVCGRLNSKNRFGGYTGSAPFVVLMKGNTVTQKLVGNPDDTIINGYIHGTCGKQTYLKV